jgi:hypothetical protein
VATACHSSNLVSELVEKLGLDISTAPCSTIWS